MGEAVAATTAVNPETSPENAPVVVAVTDMIAAQWGWFYGRLLYRTCVQEVVSDVTQPRAKGMDSITHSNDRHCLY